MSIIYLFISHLGLQINYPPLATVNVLKVELKNGVWSLEDDFPNLDMAMNIGSIFNQGGLWKLNMWSLVVI